MMSDKNKGTKEFQDLQQKYIDTTFGTVQCDECRHYIGGNRCKAFDEIPLAVVSGDFDHRNPYPGDRGILFEPKK